MEKIEIDTSKASVIGWDGDKDGVIAYMEGGYYIRDSKNVTVDFLISQGVEHFDWYNSEGYLPCLITEFEKKGCIVKILNFCDKVRVKGEDFVAVYSRVSIENKTKQDIVLLPEPVGPVISLNKAEEKIKAGESTNFDYVIAADRFGGEQGWPEDEEMVGLGGFELHYKRMKVYWDDRLDKIVRLKELPDSRLIEAYKAGFIYTHIVKDGYHLNVGENGYDEVFDHDAIGILIGLLTLGDFKDAKIFLDGIESQIQYDDAKWKYAWPFALYLLKTGDKEFIEEKYEIIKGFAYKIEADLTGPGRIVKQTWDIDNIGNWTVDNWSVLMGLTAFKYICEILGHKDEEKWAVKTYQKLLKACNQTLEATISRYGINYLTCSMVEPNSENVCRNPRNTNWASMFLFGRWAWDGYLFGAKQDSIMVKLIDATYDYGFTRGREAGLFPHSFGGGTYSDRIGSYNAGLAATGLRGEKYRSEAIYCYQAMISFGMSGPYSWWESAGEAEQGKWYGFHPVSGDGSCPHMWGQACASKALIESILAEKANGDIIVGRGIPEEWLYDGKVVELDNYPIAGNHRIGVRIEGQAQKYIKIFFSGDIPKGKFIIDLPFMKWNIISVNGGYLEDKDGTVIAEGKTRKIEIELRMLNVKKNLAYRKGVRADIVPSVDGTFSNCTNGSLSAYTQADRDIPWIPSIDLGRPTIINRIHVTTDREKYAEIFNLEVSVDNKNWTVVACERRNDGLPKVYLFDSTVARFIRMNVEKTVGGNTNSGHAVRLIEIYQD